MRWCVPIYHPAYIMRNNRRWEGVVRQDMQRALKLARGWRPTWDDKGYVIRPTAKQVVKALKAMKGKRVAYDIETDGQHPLVCTVRCIGFYDGTVGICVPFVYRDGTVELVLVPGKKKPVKKALWKPYFRGKALKLVNEAIQELFDSADKQTPEFANTKLETQNGQYDRLCLEARLGYRVPAGFDTILAHHIVASYLPHGLSTLASLYTDVEYYKTTEEGDAWSSVNDFELWQYCIRDCKVTWIAAGKLRLEIQERGEDSRLYEHDQRQELEGQRWKQTGIAVDLDALVLFQKHYSDLATRALAAMRAVIGRMNKTEIPNQNLTALMEKLLAADVKNVVDDDGSVEDRFNPGSLIQLRMLLGALGVPLSAETATGQLSTAKEFLLAARKELIEKGAKSKDLRIAFLDYLFAWREASKIHSTYLLPEILPDGRVHPTFNIHVVPGGRLSSSGPNFQNQPAEIRGMYVPRQGHVLVYGDWDSLEMRLGALLSGDETFIKEFIAYDAGTGPKIHILNACAIFNLPITKDFADKNPGCYRAAKVFSYAVAYGAGPTTVFEKVREEMPDMDWGAFEKCYANYKKKRARLMEFQSDVVKQGTSNQFLDTPILGRRVYFFERVFGEDSPEASAMQNLKYQGGAADIVSLANFRVLDKVVIPMRKKLKEGEVIEQLAQVHDELLFEVPEHLAEAFATQFKKVAEEPPPGFPSWKLPVDVKIKKRWKDIVFTCEVKSCRGQVKLKKEAVGEEVVWTGDCEKCKTPLNKTLPRVAVAA